jgi:hypothetical protein
VEAPLAESGSSSVIKDRITDALYRVDTLDVPVWEDAKREKAAACKVTCFRFSRIFRWWSETAYCFAFVTLGKSSSENVA